jgi:hypothetical protein
MATLGTSPYHKQSNMEAFSRVCQGQRLAREGLCSLPLYALLAECWHTLPEARPSFTTILTRCVRVCVRERVRVRAPLTHLHTQAVYTLQ